MKRCWPVGIASTIYVLGGVLIFAFGPITIASAIPLGILVVAGILFAWMGFRGTRWNEYPPDDEWLQRECGEEDGSP